MPSLKVYVIPLRRECTFGEIAKRSTEPISKTMVYDRWVSFGRSEKISREELEKLIMPRGRGKQSGPVSTRFLIHNEERMTYTELARREKVSRTTIANVVKKYGSVLTTEHTDKINKINWGRKPKEPESIVNARVPERIEDRSPGWLERELFPDTGKNGYCGGRSSVIFPAKLGI